MRLQLSRNSLKKLLIGSFLIRFVTHLAAAFFPPILPGTWRQSDTLGVSYRYFSKFAIENDVHGLSNWLPAVLQSGDANGVMPMEFPILNLLFSSLWAFGTVNGRISISVIMTLLVYGFTIYLFKATKGFYRWGFLLFPTVSYSADYFAKFIPDILSFLFVLASVVSTQKSENDPKHRRWSAPFMLTLGLLMKPTSIAGLLFYFVIHPIQQQTVRAFFKRFTIPVLITGFYYTVGLKWIDSYRQGQALFATLPRDPLESLRLVLSNYSAVYHHFMDRPFFFGGLPLVIIGAFYRFKRVQKLIGILLLQFLIIVALDGEHSFTHDYYYVSLAPTAATLMVYVLFVFRRNWLGIIAGLALLFRPLELSAKDIHRLSTAHKTDPAPHCEELKKRNPGFPWGRGAVFRANDEPFPSLGLCFGEREGSQTADFGFYYVSRNFIPEHCKEVDRDGDLMLAKCGQR